MDSGAAQRLQFSHPEVLIGGSEEEVLILIPDPDADIPAGQPPSSSSIPFTGGDRRPLINPQLGTREL